FDDSGNSIVDQKGELVCTFPFPSMPVYFWNDENGKKYFNAYFNKYSGVWRHGDYIKITSSGGIIVYGRSDATLNPGGVRIGTAEIYRIVETMDEISDSLVIGENINNDVRVILFVVLQGKLELSDELVKKIKSKIKSFATPRHVPSLIFSVDDIPRTISGKKVEIAVTKIFNCGSIENKDAFINPESLAQYYSIKSKIE
ncbi:MAG: acetoacetate--CoA ligase, partial [Ignavibacteriaceae bacterium]|nr:acetoacetate--CoA ligase [Ignavibacteriaceae bacterium]